MGLEVSRSLILNRLQNFCSTVQDQIISDLADAQQHEQYMGALAQAHNLRDFGHAYINAALLRCTNDKKVRANIERAWRAKQTLSSAIERAKDALMLHA